MIPLEFDEAVSILEMTAPQGYYKSLFDFEEFQALSKENKLIFANANLFLAFNKLIHKNFFVSLRWDNQLAVNIPKIKELILALDDALAEEGALLHKFNGVKLHDPVYHFLMLDALTDAILNHSIYSGKSVDSFRGYLENKVLKFKDGLNFAFLQEQAFIVRMMEVKKWSLAHLNKNSRLFYTQEEQKLVDNVLSKNLMSTVDFFKLRYIAIPKEYIKEKCYVQERESIIIKNEVEVAVLDIEAIIKKRKEDQKKEKNIRKQILRRNIHINQQKEAKANKFKKHRLQMLHKKLSDTPISQIKATAKALALNLTEKEYQIVLSERIRQSNCPRPKKRTYQSINEGNLVISKRFAQDPTIESYLCKCGKVHIGHPV